MPAANPTAVRAEIDGRSRAAHPRLVEARRYLHAHQELSNREVLTAGEQIAALTGQAALPAGK